MRQFLLSILVAFVLLLGGMTSSFAQSVKTTYDFSTAATLSFGSGGFGIWNTQADITIDGTAYRLTCGGNGSFTNATTGGASNSKCLQKDGAGGDQFTLQRADGQPFQFYGIWVKHQSMNSYTIPPTSLTLPPWYTLTANTFTYQDNTPMTSGTAWNNYTGSSIPISAGTNGVTTTSVSINFPAILYFWIDDIIVGPVPASPPTATTNAASSVSSTGATLNGSINANNASTTVAFEYGLTTSYGSTVTADQSPVTGSSATSVSKAITGLTAGTTYHYRVKGVNAGGTTNGSDQTFTTLSTSLSGSTGGTSIAQNTPIYIASSAIVTGSTLNGAIVSISGNFASSQDILGIDGTQSGTTSSISYTYDSSKGILTLTGVADVATYQTILRKVTYTNTSATPSTDSRSITISLNKALPYSANGHYYEFVPSSGIKWTDAKTAAEELNYFGLKGYLATITDEDENDFCTAKLSGDGWMGATDTDTEGTWKWVTGPEAGQTFSYTNWNSGQPDNYLGVEDYAQFYVTGKWNDLPNLEPSIVGYVVEYGGSAGDPTLDISDVVTVNFSVPVSTAASGIQSNSFQANWNALSGATNYYLDVATNSSFTSMVTGYNNKDVGNVTTYKVEGLNPVTTYYYRVRATSLASGYNSNASSATTIKADQTITFNALSAKAYGDIDFSPAATASSGLTVSYTTSDPNVATISGDLIHIVGTGTCTIYADQSGDDTYNAAPQASQQLTVNKATLTVTADAKSKVYGDVNPALTFKYSGWKNSETETVIDTKPIAATTVTYTTSVGTYSITVSGGADNNYSFSYVPADFEVTAAALTVTADAKTKVYGDDNPTLTFQYSGWKNGDDDLDLDTKPTASTTVTNTTSVGTYTDVITVSSGSDNNYSFAYVPADFEITAATLTVTAEAKTKVYGDANPALTFQYSGWKNSETETVIDTKPTATTTVNQLSNVGTYTNSITVSGGSDNNYSFSYVPADFEITAATLTVTADAKTKVYGDNNPTLTFQYSGWKNSDDESDLNTQPIASTTVTNTTSVGTYTGVITISGGADNNYSFAYVPADFAVTASTLTVTADAKTKIYGDTNPALTFQYSGWKNSETETVIDTKPTAATTVNQLSNVGTYTNSITVSGGSDNNYTFSFVPADFEVTAATLTVTADAKTKVYGDANPTLTFQYSGWKNSDDDSDLDIKPTASTTVTNTTSVGTYTDVITVSGGADNNYAFSYIPADFEITKAMLTVTADSQSKAFGAPNPSLTFQYSGWKNGETESVLNTKPTASTTITDTTPVGTYENAITVSGGSDNNYDFTYVSASFTVNKGKLIIWLDQKTKNYGDENPTLTYRYTGFMNGDDESDLDYIPYPSTSVTRYTNAGIYASSITMTGGLDDNYYIVNVPANFIVNKAPLTVKADDKTKAYGTANPDLTLTISGWKNGESEAILDVKPVVSTSVNATTLPGVYPNTITAQTGSDNNYRFEYVAGTFTVTQANQSIVFNALAPKTYGDEPFILSATSNSGLTISYTCINSDVAIVSGNTVNLIGAGTAVITASQPGDSNYLPAATVSQTLTVNRKPLFVEGIAAVSKVYDGNASAVLTGGTLTGTINQDVITLNNATTGTFSQTWVGTAIPVASAMTISGEKAANYVLSIPDLKADITPMAIAVTAQNAGRTCDQSEQPLSYTFEPSLIGTDTFTGTLARTAGNIPGIYPITQGTLSLGTNYSINFTGASYTITNIKNLAPAIDQPSNLTVLKNSKEVTVTLTGIDPVSNCMAQDIESIVATADNKNLIPEIVVDYTKGQPTAKLKLKIADGLNGETTIHVKLKDNGGTENNGTDTKEISFSIKVEIPVGVEDLTQNFDVRVYPNPSKGLIKIETSGFNRPSVRIFKVTGEEVMKKMNLIDPIETMDLSGNAPGIYFVEISDQTNTVTKKLILRN